MERALCHTDAADSRAGRIAAGAVEGYAVRMHPTTDTYALHDAHSRAAMVEAMAEVLARGTAAPWWQTSCHEFWRRKAREALAVAEEHTTRVALERRRTVPSPA